MDFTKGKQIVFHNSTYTDFGGKPFIPPFSMKTRQVNPSDSILQVFNDTADFVSSVGKLDAMHFISHGMIVNGKPNGFQFGKENVSIDTIPSFITLAGSTRTIVIWACQAGSTIVPGGPTDWGSIGNAIANVVGTRVIVGKENQGGSGFNASPSAGGLRKFDPDHFLGEVYLCHPKGDPTVVFNDPRTGRTQMDLDGYIFNGTR